MVPEARWGAVGRPHEPPGSDVSPAPGGASEKGRGKPAAALYRPTFRVHVNEYRWWTTRIAVTGRVARECRDGNTPGMAAHDGPRKRFRRRRGGGRDSPGAAFPGHPSG